MPRFALIAATSFIALAGCNYTLYHQAGKSFAERDADVTRCDVIALRKAPVETQILFTQPRQEERTICDDDGNCITETYWTKPEPYTVDPNKELRERVAMQCMLDKGYQQISLPSCDDGQTLSVPTKMTNIGPNSCAVRLKGGAVRIAQPG